MSGSIHIIGPRGTGKTTIARGLVVEHVRGGGWAFVHDPMRQFMDLARSYESPAAWKAEAARAAKAKQPMHRAARFTCESGDVVKLCVELGDRHNRAKSIRLPMMLVIDETAMHSTSGPSWMSKEDNALLSTARHKGIVLVFVQQRVSQFPIQFYEMASDVYLFRSPARKLEELEEALAIAPGSLAQVPTLHIPENGPTATDPAEFVHVKYAKGLV